MLLLVAFTFFVAGVVKGTVGLGLPIVTLVFLAVPLGVTSAISLILFPGLVTNFVQAVKGPSLRALLLRLWSFLLASVIGIWLGVGLLSSVAPETALIALGAILSFYSVISLLSPQIRPPGRHERILSPLAGGTGGVIFGVTGVFIVPGILYLQALGIAFMTLNIALFGAFLDKGLLTQDLALTSIGAIVPTLIGLNVGQRFRHRISEDLFRTIFFWVLLAVGVRFVIAGVW